MTSKTHITRSVIVTAIISLQSFAMAVPLRFIPWDDAVAARKIGLQNASGLTELKHLHPHKRSDSTEVSSTKESPLRLVALDRLDPEGRPITLELKLNPEFKSPLILLLPDPKHASGLRTFVIEDNSDNFNWGSLRFINATGKELLVRQDKTVKSLPNKWTPVDFKPGGEMRNMAMQVAAREDLNAILFSGVWEHNPDMRKLIFVIPGTDVRTGPVAFKIIPEDRRALALEASIKSSGNNASAPPSENP
jgi:hypothetical protein